jgi:hypothetical protein
MQAAPALPAARHGTPRARTVLLVNPFELLGTPAMDKRHVIYEAGHFVPRDQLVKETLDWYDRYLGPVRGARKAPAEAKQP